jgi:hypothetical protein
MAQHGGYRKPANPAAVSGPGRHARRTDGKPGQSISTVPDQPYGDASQQAAAQRIAPMGGQTPMPPAVGLAQQSGDNSAAGPAMPTYQGSPLNGPSTRPNEPITAGVNTGPGPGSEVLSNPMVGQSGVGTDRYLSNLLQRASATDTTGVLAPLLQAAVSHGV